MLGVTLVLALALPYPSIHADEARVPAGEEMIDLLQSKFGLGPAPEAPRVREGNDVSASQLPEE